MLNKANTLKEEIIRLRREIHQHPELGFQEFRTAALVAETLAEIGLGEIKTEVGRTGVVAEIGRGDGPVIGIRADMDALPIQEDVDVPFVSQNDGVMHACGHDTHTAMLLGAAHLLKQSFAENGDQWRGKIRLLFQPSEEAFDENGISGATAMIDDGALEGVDNIIALHIISNIPAGLCVFNDGYSMAAVDSFEAWVRGSGGHGAYPHEGTDPLFMTSSILPNLYAIPSRYVNPLNPSIVSLGRVSGGMADNVIPNEVHFKGTIRSFDEETRHKLWAEIERAFKLAETLGGSYKLRIDQGYPASYNEPAVNSWMRQVAADLAGQDKVIDQPFGMGAEDFAYMQQAAPGAMFLLGGQVSGGGNHHTPTFDIDESVLPLGSAVLAETARRYVMGELG
ncbi:MAG: amidohydrolase [Ardenticatenaceae bacterium]|nr:amidohydrolase [Ardenticatenaceae bacterium]